MGVNIMKLSGKLLVLILSVLVLLISGCGLQTTHTPTILGTLSDSNGAIVDAEVTLVSYEDEACVNLSEKSELTDSESQQLDSCSGDYATVTSDDEGNFEFSEISPGWYKLHIAWFLSQKPSSPFPFEVRNGYLIAYYEVNTNPTTYSALALGDIFQFSGEEDFVINFDYGEP